MSGLTVLYYKILLRTYIALGREVCRSWKVKEQSGVILPVSSSMGWNVYDSIENAQRKRGLIASVCGESFYVSKTNSGCRVLIESVVLLNGDTRKPTLAEKQGDLEFDSDDENSDDE
jgi:hypothetical protein